MSKGDFPRVTVTAIAGIAANSALSDALAGRAKVLTMTQEAEAAVLTPTECGAFSHDMRAVLAARMAWQNVDAELAERYVAMVADRSIAPLADPANNGATQGLTVICAFMDKVATNTHNVKAADIADLQAAGIEDADIVRLCELNAFMAYQARVIAGLRLMRERTS